MKFIFKISFFLSLSVLTWANQNTDDVVCSLRQGGSLIGYTNNRPFELLANNSVQGSYETVHELLERLKFLKTNKYCVVKKATSCSATGEYLPYKGSSYSIDIDENTFGITRDEKLRDDILFKLIALGVCPKESYKIPKK